MQSLRDFIVRLDKRSNDTIKTESGLELYVDSKFEEFERRVNEGEIISTPYKFDTGAKPGDTLYFHHHVVTQKAQQIDELKTDKSLENAYVVKYSRENELGNQSFCYKSKDTGELKPLWGWTILEPLEEEEEEQVGLIEVVKLKKDPVLKARVFLESDFTKQNNLKIGDVVGIIKGMDYKFVIDEKPYFRTRNVDILYVEEQV